MTASRPALIREPDFRRLWFIGGLGEAMRWLELLTVSVYVFDATHSALIVTLVNFCRGLPLLLLGPAVGSIAERIDRRRILVWSATLPLVTTATVGTLALFGPVDIWLLALCGFASGVAFTTELPVRRNMIGEAAGIDRIAAGMGLDGITRQATRIVGPAMGGLLLREIGLQGSFLLAASLYAVCLVLALRVRMGGSAPVEGKDRESATLFASMVEGLRYVRGHPPLLAVLSVSLIAQMFLFPYMSLIPAIGKTALGLDAFTIGLLTSIEGLGALLAASAVALWATSAHFRRIYVVGAALFGAGILAFSLAPVYGVALAVLFLGGLGLGGFSTMQATIPYVSARADMRARMMSLVGALFGVGLFGFLHIGLMAEWMGAAAAVTTTAIEALLLLTLTAYYWRRHAPEREAGLGPGR
ncbi:MAG: MFS transporter [Alphaproteobacteria bacterium]|nr:MFS transporter [Alphaproteobacteria bacterium]